MHQDKQTRINETFTQLHLEFVDVAHQKAAENAIGYIRQASELAEKFTKRHDWKNQSTRAVKSKINKLLFNAECQTNIIPKDHPVVEKLNAVRANMLKNPFYSFEMYIALEAKILGGIQHIQPGGLDELVQVSIFDDK